MHVQKLWCGAGLFLPFIIEGKLLKEKKRIERRKMECMKGNKPMIMRHKLIWGWRVHLTKKVKLSLLSFVCYKKATVLILAVRTFQNIKVIWSSLASLNHKQQYNRSKRQCILVKTSGWKREFWVCSINHVPVTRRM